VAPYLGSLVNQDHEEQKGNESETFEWRKKWLERNRSHIGSDMPLLCGIGARMDATPELIKKGIKAALEGPAKIDGLVLKHYDGASFSHMRAFRQGMIDAGVQGLRPIIGKEVEEMELDNYAPMQEEFVEEWGVETQGKATASYSFNDSSGPYDIRITYFDEDDGQGRVTLLIAGKEIDTVYCLSVENGEEVWKYSYPCEPGTYAGPRSTPVYSDGFIYTVSQEGLLICFAAESGEILWQKDLANDANAVAPKWGISSSVIIKGNMLLLNVGKYGLAMDKKDGTIIWQSPKALCCYASPVPYSLDGKDCMVAFGQKALYGVDADSGKLLWTQKWITKLDEQSADPVVWENHVFVSSIYSKGCAVFDISDNQPKEVWLNDTLVNKFSSSLLYEGKLYGVHGNTIKRKGNSWDVGRRKGALCCGFRDRRIALGRRCWHCLPDHRRWQTYCPERTGRIDHCASHA
jgi:outer membrane protein assembly factor BamB